MHPRRHAIRTYWRWPRGIKHVPPSHPEAGQGSGLSASLVDSTVRYVTNSDYHGWRLALRSLRANPPRSAAKGARAATFRAGLHQAEHLWAAGSAVGASASPILLFYGLTQAGRALCAAAGVPEGAESHGLEFKTRRPQTGSAIELSQVEIMQRGDGLAVRVADLLGSPLLAHAAPLSSLIAALDIQLAFGETDLDPFRPLHAAGGESPSEVNPYQDAATGELMLWPVPDALIRREHVPADGGRPGYTRQRPAPNEEFQAWLSHYPRLAAFGSPTHLGKIVALPGSSPQITVTWDVAVVDRSPKQIEWVRTAIDVIDPSPGQVLQGTILPAVGGNTAALHPLMGWWLVLYALSMLARYYPGPWRASLDVDHSRTAVPLEHLLQSAATNVPTLVLQVLDELVH